MNRLYNKISTLLRQISGSIAFYPALFALAFSALAILVMWLEYRDFMLDLKQSLNYLLVKSREDARLILGTLVGSLFSLMVFSFSMVMLVLNRASTSLTPRVIPGLITHKPNQVVLGVYLGSIVYSLLLIVNIQGDQQDHTIPSFGVLLAMLFGILSLVMFMYFIHSISQSIQVDKILERTRRVATRQMRKMSTRSFEGTIPGGSLARDIVVTGRSGYLRNVDRDRLAKLCQKHDLTLWLLEPIGSYLTEHTPYLEVSRPLPAEVKESIDSCFLFYPEERLDDHYFFGFKQISEIAIKALSPGVNDPGTAHTAIDMLLELLLEKTVLPEERPLKRPDASNALIFSKVPLDHLLWSYIAPIREYGKGDVKIVLHLLGALQKLRRAASESGSEACLLHMVSVLDSARQNLCNPADRFAVNREIRRINANSANLPILEELA